MTVIGFKHYREFSLVGITCISVTVLCNRTLAQNRLTPDNSLGQENSTALPRPGQPNFDVIRGGARRGKSLVHSFETFNVREGRGVIFANPKGVNNIFTRVTGSVHSNILGELGVGGPANLFLLNPNGITFGPKATLNIAGSFFASSAEVLDLGDGIEFRADTSGVPSLLTIKVPVGVQFGPGAVVNQGNLNSGRDLKLESDRLIVGGELSSGRNLELRSPKRILSTAQLFSGQDFRVEGVNETAGRLVSPNGQIILAKRNVAIDNFFGGSLHVLAGGRVRLDNVRIEQDGSDESTINPGNQDKATGTLTFADLASFEIPDFELQQNEQGRLRQVPIRRAIAIDGSKQATLDVRAGVNWDQLGGIEQSKVSEDISLPKGRDRTSRIAVGRARIEQPEGKVLLTNRFRPHLELDAGAMADGHSETIVTSTIDTSLEGIELNAGNVSILGVGNISNRFIDTSSTVELDESQLPNKVPLNRGDKSGTAGDVIISSISGNISNRGIDSNSLGNTGNGAAITVTSRSGSINNRELISNSSSDGETGNGGAITVTSHSGHINNRNLISNSLSFNRDTVGDTGNGGAITVTSHSGHINNRNLRTNSFSFNGDTGNGGEITVTSHSGHIDNREIISNSFSLDGNTGNGAAIMVTSHSGHINNRDLNSNSFSIQGNTGNGGEITITSHSGHIDNSEVISNSFSLNGNTGNGAAITVTSHSGHINNREFRSNSNSSNGDTGNGGAIMVTSNGNIDNRDFRSNSSSFDGNTKNGGAITITSRTGHIDNRDFRSNSFSGAGNTGNGGAITVTSRSGHIDNRDLSSNSFSGAGNTGNGGGITIASRSGHIDNRDLLSISFSSDGDTRNGGAITVSSNTGDIILKGDLSTFSLSEKGSVGNAGNGRFTVNRGSILGITEAEKPRFLTFSIGSTGSGQGGSIVLKAQSIRNLDLQTQSSNKISGGVKIESPSRSLLVRDIDVIAGARLEIPNPLSEPDDPRPPIIIDSTQLGTSTSGNVTISSPFNARLENVTIESDSNGNNPAGTIQVQSKQLLSIKGSEIRTNANAGGIAGNLDIKAETFILDSTQLNATTLSQRKIDRSQGDIDINVDGLILLTNNSEISTEGFEQATGGNITINAPENPLLLLVGLPSRGGGNDITANASQAAGGDITINAQSIQGFTRSQPRLNSNDINAGSRTNLQGTININSVDVDPNDNKPSPPESFNPPLLQSTCQPTKNSFVDIKQGGIAPLFERTPTMLWDDTRSTHFSHSQMPAIEHHTLTTVYPPPLPPKPITEAQEWIQASDGTIHLISQIANRPAISSHSDTCTTSLNAHP